MNWRRLAVIAAAVTIATLAGAPARAQSSAPASSPALNAYLEGLDALIQGRWPEAVTAFSRSLQANAGDASVMLARGVARGLAEQFPEAIADLQQAGRMGLKGREAELWTYAVETMSGLATPEHALGRPPGRTSGPATPGVVSIPGHIIQGRDDYPTDYASFVGYEMAVPYGRARKSRDRVDASEIRSAMAAAGRWFANRAMTRADLAPAHLARGQKLHAAQQYDAALTELGFARAAYPGDAAVAFFMGDSWLGLERPATARRELTIALTARTDLAAGYVARAKASARLGDATRAKADLDAATALDSGMSRHRPPVDAELNRTRGEPGTAARLAQLEQAARAAAPMDQLVALAMDLHRAGAAGRLHYDEVYQDRLRVLEGAVRANPRSPDKLGELARYLTEESDGRGEVVEPRRALVPYRWRLSKAAELARAERAVDQALQLAPDHVAALMQKATIRAERGQHADADGLANRALALAPNNADALVLYARYRARNAHALLGQVAGLRQDTCTSTSHTETRSDGVYRVTRTTCVPPSQADLLHAKRLEAQAAELKRRAQAAIEAALRVTRGTVEGHLLQADVETWRGQYDAAVRALQAALKQDPRSLEAHEALADLYMKTGDKDRGLQQDAVAKNLVHTTAGPLLKLAWGRITANQFQPARAALTEARQRDPLDARVPAYLGMILHAEGKAEDAAAAWRMAVAMEDARVQLDEPANRGGASRHRDALDFGLSMALRLRMATIATKQGRHQEALDLYRANLVYEPRISPTGRGTDMFSAMLPDPAAPALPVPAPPNASTLLVESLTGAGHSLTALGRQQEAREAFERATAYGHRRGVPRVGTASGDSNFKGDANAGAAALELARAAYDAGEYQRAAEILRNAAGTFPRERMREANDLHRLIAQKLNAQRSRPYPR